MKFEKLEWDSKFFGRNIYLLNINGDLKVNSEDVDKSLKGASGVSHAEFEVRISSKNINLVPIIEEAGFRLVDSKISFSSLINIKNIPSWNVPFGCFRQAEEKDLNRIKQLTIDNLVDNVAFVSRYKNRELYSRDESIKYYMAWNDLVFSNQPEFFVVWEVENEVVAFFTYYQSETGGFYKGILTAVDKNYRGHSIQNEMQYYLFKKFEKEEFVVENATQISNIPVIRNHIKSSRRLEDVILIFRKK
jgi:hypothetical protein